MEEVAEEEIIVVEAGVATAIIEVDEAVVDADHIVINPTTIDRVTTTAMGVEEVDVQEIDSVLDR